MQFNVLDRYTDAGAMLAAIEKMKGGDVYHITFRRDPDDLEQEELDAKAFWRLCGERANGAVMPLEFVYEAQRHNLNFVVNREGVHGWSGCFTYKVKVRAVTKLLRSGLRRLVRDGRIASIEKLAAVAAAA